MWQSIKEHKILEGKDLIIIILLVLGDIFLLYSTQIVINSIFHHTYNVRMSIIDPHHQQQHILVY